MKTPRWTHASWFRITAALLCLLVAFWIGRSSVKHASHEHDAEHDHTAETTTGKPQIYTCSMHPQVRTPDANEKCPICAMDLIPVPQDEDDADDDVDVPRLRVSRRAAALMDIQTQPAARRTFEMELPLFGTVGPDESRVVQIAARTDAYIEKLLANTPWHPVAVGDVLAELYSPAAVTAMQELRMAREGSTAMRDAARSRLQRMGLNEEQIAETETLDAAPRTFRIVSPVDGMVQELSTREGEWLREGQSLVRLVDLSQVWINLEAYERDLPWIRAGAPITFTVQSLPGQTFEGSVTFIEPVVHARTRTVNLRVEAENPEGLLKPGMFVAATLQASLGDADAAPPLLVPASAPLVMGRRALVYVKVPDTDRPTFEPRHVTLGPRNRDFRVIESGLQEGELVVVHGQFKIDSELQIRGRPSMMAPTGDGAPAHDHGEHEGHAMSDTRQLQTQCPVMGGAINTEHFVDVEGCRIYVCCPGCDDTILENPQRYIDKMKADGITLYRLQTHCPIMDFPINRDLYHDHDGQRIYICCPGCIDEIKARPEEIIAEQRKKGIVFEVTP